MTSDELSHMLTMAGLEVEEVEAVAPPFTNVVAPRFAKSPNTQMQIVSMCQVDVGTGTLVNIVCGAPNVRAGMKVPCLRDGWCSLPPGRDGVSFLIKVGELRWESQGVVLGARTQNFSEDHGDLMDLPTDAPVGQNFRDYYQLNDLKFNDQIDNRIRQIVCLCWGGAVRFRH